MLKHTLISDSARKIFRPANEMLKFSICSVSFSNGPNAGKWSANIPTIYKHWIYALSPLLILRIHRFHLIPKLKNRALGSRKTRKYFLISDERIGKKKQQRKSFIYLFIFHSMKYLLYIAEISFHFLKFPIALQFYIKKKNLSIRLWCNKNSKHTQQPQLLATI